MKKEISIWVFGKRILLGRYYNKDEFKFLMEKADDFLKCQHNSFDEEMKDMSNIAFEVLKAI